jgi:dUTPase
VRKGDRIAQLICEKICYPELVMLEVKLKNTSSLRNATDAFIYISFFNL